MRTMVQVQTLSGRPPDETYGPGRYSARQPEPASSREGPKGLRTLRWSKGDSNSWSRSHAALSKTLAPSIVRLRGRSIIRDQEFESFPPGKSPVRTSSNQLRNQISADDPSAGSSVNVKAGRSCLVTIRPYLLHPFQRPNGLDNGEAGDIGGDRLLQTSPR
jgi:hypothetical protein